MSHMRAGLCDCFSCLAKARRFLTIIAIRSVSRWVGAARNMANSVKDEISQELKIQELQENLKKAEQMGMKDLSPDLRDSVDELKKAASEVQRPYAEKNEHTSATTSQKQD